MNKMSGWTVIFHWAVAIAVLGLLLLGYYMKTTQTFSLYPIHKSLGILALFIILARVIWRVREGWPAPLPTHKKREVRLSRFIQWTLLIATIGMPVSGILMGAASGHGIALFGLEIVPRNPDPSNPAAVIAFSPVLDSVGHWIHEWLSYAMVAALVLHLFGALKHHFFDKDHTLRRMMGAKG